MTLIWPFNATQGQISWGKLKDHIWFNIYVFHATFDKMLHLGDATFWKSCELDFTLKGYPRWGGGGTPHLQHQISVCCQWPEQHVLWAFSSRQCVASWGLHGGISGCRIFVQPDWQASHPLLTLKIKWQRIILKTRFWFEYDVTSAHRHMWAISVPKWYIL